VLRWGLRALADSGIARELIPRVPITRAMSRRFVAGESLDDFVGVVRETRRQGMDVTGNYLGEAITDPARAGEAAEEYLRLLDRLRDEGLDVNVSVKPSQMGMDVSGSVLLANVRALLARAREASAFVRFDMESSAYTDRTLDLLRTLWDEGHRRIGAVLQASLRRTAGDLEGLLRIGIPVRLCKGAYAEPPEIAFQGAEQIRSRFRELMATLLRDGTDPAIATHDETLIRDGLELARESGLSPARFELQLLYGVRRDLQKELVRRGHRVRVYIPFGVNWYPYLMRRLAERPENVLFVAGSMLKESPLGTLFPGARGLGRES